ncbi:hypothetical protein CK203_087511 [Vitis vinifera]|uniref:DUF4216 domain-containing protein n=1 Tax=Vitis vinifera TaxID=29760 RepID=A0A438DA72_VITVI|nr:hypothetical protein CK203_087511 [Vitis vinifera]
MDRSWMSKDRRSKDYANGSYHTWYWHGDAAPSGPPTSRAEWHHTVEFNDVDSTIEMVQVAYDDCKNDPKLFETLLEDAQKPLHPGCRNFTKLSALVKLYNLKARYGWSDKSFSELLSILGDMLPLNNELPLSINELKDATSCPTCGTSRWKLDGTEREFDGKMRHPSDSPSWKLVDHRWPDFASEPRNLRLSISADDINPHSSMSSRHSCWPIIMVIYNLPPWMCMKRKFMMLSLLISGVECYDVHQQEVFTLRVVLLWTINDFPAYGNLSGCVVKGYFACPICGEDTFSHRLKHGKKNSYTGHRRFLLCNHPFRKQNKAFNGKQEFSSPPQPLSGEEILRKIDVISNSWGKNKNSRGKLNVNTTNCWKKKSIFFDLEYWKYLHVRHSLDAMHIEKNVCESIIGTLLNIPGKTKDGLNSRLDLLEMGLRCELGPSKVVDVSALDKLQNDLVVTLCLLEKYFPPSFFDIMLHLTVHLIREIEAAIGNNEPIFETHKWIAHGPSHYVTKYHGYVINGCRYHTKERDDLRATQNSGVSIVASTMQIASANDQNPVFGELCFYGIITKIWDLDYTMFRISIFKCDWVDNKNGIKVYDLGFTLVDFSKIAHKSDPFILTSQAKQVFYVQDQLDPRWSVVLSTPQKDFLDMEGGEDFC